MPPASGTDDGVVTPPSSQAPPTAAVSAQARADATPQEIHVKPADFLNSFISAEGNILDSRTREALEILNQNLAAPTARILMPSEEQVRVQLVSVQALKRLDDQRSLMSTVIATITFFAGGALAFLVNVFTGATVTSQGWVFLGLLVLLDIALGVFASKIATKTREIESLIYPDSKA